MKRMLLELEKIDVPLFALDENIVSSVEAMAKEEMIKAISIPGKLERYAALMISLKLVR